MKMRAVRVLAFFVLVLGLGVCQDENGGEGDTTTTMPAAKEAKRRKTLSFLKAGLTDALKT
jgi:hypothetical protein